MEKEKHILKGMREFVLEYSKIKDKSTEGAETWEDCEKEFTKYIDLTENYANFLSQPLSIEMFVPAKLVDGIWVVLEEPEENDLNRSFFKMQTNYHAEKEYQEAKERVLFDGWKFSWRDTNILLIEDKEGNLIEFMTNGSIWIFDEYMVYTITDLSFYSEKENIKLILTESTAKKLGLT